MQNGFPYLDILIFGVIAIFLIFRLKNILGTKNGLEDDNFNEKNQSKQFSNVVSLKSSKNNSNNIEVDKILKVDPNFDIVYFLIGLKNFFERYIKSLFTFCGYRLLLSYWNIMIISHRHFYVLY